VLLAKDFNPWRFLTVVEVISNLRLFRCAIAQKFTPLQNRELEIPNSLLKSVNRSMWGLIPFHKILDTNSPPCLPCPPCLPTCQMYQTYGETVLNPSEDTTDH
jgi:hypothetical protein